MIGYADHIEKINFGEIKELVIPLLNRIIDIFKIYKTLQITHER